MCCKLIAVTELGKQPGTWCPHCVRGRGCGIYETRPTECRTFFCHWMVEKGLGPDWKPERSKIILVTSQGGHLTAFVDPGTPRRGVGHLTSTRCGAGRAMVRARSRCGSCPCASEHAAS